MKKQVLTFIAVSLLSTSVAMASSVKFTTNVDFSKPGMPVGSYSAQDYETLSLYDEAKIAGAGSQVDEKAFEQLALYDEVK